MRNLYSVVASDDVSKLTGKGIEFLTDRTGEIVLAKFIDGEMMCYQVARPVKIAASNVELEVTKAVA